MTDDYRKRRRRSAPAFLLSPLALVLAGCGSSHVAPAPGPNESAEGKAATTVVLTSQVTWQQLNPARPASPKAGTLWGDRNGSAATGYLLRPTDGFESPPHIHNVSYRGVVIRGLIHNDDPKAERMWMPQGSFWTQPKGAVHITAAKGSDTLAYIEIDEGPYLVRSVDQAFASKEKPVNVDASNIVWVNASSILRPEQRATSATADGARVAFLWGNPHDKQPSGILLELPAGSTTTMRGHGSTFRAVVVQGQPEHRVPGKTTVRLEPGSYLSSTGSVPVACGAAQDCVIYVRMEAGTFDVVSATSAGRRRSSDGAQPTAN